MIVDHACSLHECVADGRADELETARLEVFAHRIRLFRTRWYLLQRFPFVLDGLATSEAPDVLVE